MLRLTVLANHCANLLPTNARTGIIEDNPIHYDMLWAAKKAGLAFIVNVVINERKEAVHAVAGDAEIAHLAGCEFLNSLCRTEAMPADIVVSSNGGYPLDQNIYQAVKGMTAAEATVKKDGVIIMLAKSEDGHGGENFYRQMSEEADIGKTLAAMLKRDRNETEPDQWQAQIFIRVLQKATVIYVSDAPDEMVRNLHMITTIPGRSGEGRDDRRLVKCRHYRHTRRSCRYCGLDNFGSDAVKSRVGTIVA